MTKQPNRFHVDWDRLRTFYTVAKSGSFTSAGHAMNMSQPALSRQISSLEAMLGTQLFKRLSKGLVLTRAGKQLFNHVTAIHAQMNAFYETLGSKRFDAQNELRIGLPKQLFGMFQTGIQNFQRKHPYLILKLIKDCPHLSLNELDIDVALRAFQASDKTLEQRSLGFISKDLLSWEDEMSLSSQKQKELLEFFFVTPQRLKNHETLNGLLEDLKICIPLS